MQIILKNHINIIFSIIITYVLGTLSEILPKTTDSSVSSSEKNNSKTLSKILSSIGISPETMQPLHVLDDLNIDNMNNEDGKSDNISSMNVDETTNLNNLTSLRSTDMESINSTAENSSFASIFTDDVNTTLSVNTTLNNDVVVPVTTPSNKTLETFPATVYHRTIEWLSDSRTLEILIPVSAGLVIASVIILMIATCRCMRRRYYRQRLRRKILPEDVRNMRPSDRARLLAESSDEEF